MSSIIAADTGPLIALSVLDLLPTISSLFEKIYVPQAVIYEATHAIDRPGARGISDALRRGLLIETEVTPSKTLSQLSLLLDRGESEALTLAKHLDAIALIDERKGRRVAERHGIAVVGSVAVLIKAKREGKIPTIKPLLNTLSKHGYRISKPLQQQALMLCDEL